MKQVLIPFITLLISLDVESQSSLSSVFPITAFASESFDISAETERAQILKVLTDYMEGTANGEPDRLREAFHEHLNLYFVKEGSLEVWSGKHYIQNVKQGVKSNRIGKVLSIDYEKDAAMAKIEILMPDRSMVFTDYLMLLKINGRWKIKHKSFTSKNSNS